MVTEFGKRIKHEYKYTYIYIILYMINGGIPAAYIFGMIRSI